MGHPKGSRGETLRRGPVRGDAAPPSPSRGEGHAKDQGEGSRQHQNRGAGAQKQGCGNDMWAERRAPSWLNLFGGSLTLHLTASAIARATVSSFSFRSALRGKDTIGIELEIILLMEIIGMDMPTHL
jgi:hypothetical protein